MEENKEVFVITSTDVVSNTTHIVGVYSTKSLAETYLNKYREIEKKDGYKLEIVPNLYFTK